MEDISKRYSLEGIEIEPEVKAYISQKLKIQEKLGLNKDLQVLFSKEQIDKMDHSQKSGQRNEKNK